MYNLLSFLKLFTDDLYLCLVKNVHSQHFTVLYHLFKIRYNDTTYNNVYGAITVTSLFIVWDVSQLHNMSV